MSTSIAKVVAGGDTLSLSCPSGSAPQVRVGDLLPSADDAQFFVAKVSGESFVLGPLQVGTFELSVNCSDNSEIKNTIEVHAQDPQQLPPFEGPLGLIAFNLWWFWALIAALILISAASVFWVRHRKNRARAEIKRKAELAKPRARDSGQLLRDMIATLEQLEKSPGASNLKADEIYQKGYRSIRGFLEKELKLKTQAETTPQFLGSLKIIAAKHKIPSELVVQIERSLVFSDQNRFGAAASDSAEARKQYAKEVKGILQSLLKQSASWATAQATKPIRRGSKP
jgi:hypothetical protein